MKRKEKLYLKSAERNHIRVYPFRSKTECLWAVMFDLLKIDYEYEPIAVHFGNFKYVPDFYFPKFHCWGEVKAQRRTAREARKSKRFCKVVKQPIYFLEGLPSPTKLIHGYDGSAEVENVRLTCNGFEHTSYSAKQLALFGENKLGKTLIRVAKEVRKINGLDWQTNCSGFNDPKVKRATLKVLKSGWVDWVEVKNELKQINILRSDDYSKRKILIQISESGLKVWLMHS